MNYTTSGEIARVFDPQPWVKDAACRGLTALFFSDSAVDTKQAKAVCATCPVFDQCREAADDELVRGGGVWAGQGSTDRRNARMRARVATPPEHEHGTFAGYQMHQRWKTPVCGPCGEARRLRRLAIREAKREQLARAAEFRNNGGHALDWYEEGAA